MIDNNWWSQLAVEWKLAFRTVFFHHSNEPTNDELAQLYHTLALRFAGPKAPYPNINFELSDLSGLSRLDNLEILVATHHHFTSTVEIRPLKKMKSLFLNNNRIQGLEGIDSMTELQQLYVQNNRLKSLKPIEQLWNLKEVYIHDNNFSTFEGLRENHSEKLTHFFCLPGNKIKQKELIRIENNIGIKCRSI